MVFESTNSHLDTRNVIPPSRKWEILSRLTEGVQELLSATASHGTVVVEPENPFFAPLSNAASPSGGERFNSKDIAFGEFDAVVTASIRHVRFRVSIVVTKTVPTEIDDRMVSVFSNRLLDSLSNDTRMNTSLNTIKCRNNYSSMNPRYYLSIVSPRASVEISTSCIWS